MPLPMPKKGEKRSDFVSRFMASGAPKEFKSKEQALAVAYSQWRKAHGSNAGRKGQGKS